MAKQKLFAVACVVLVSVLVVEARCFSARPPDASSGQREGVSGPLKESIELGRQIQKLEQARARFDQSGWTPAIRDEVAGWIENGGVLVQRIAARLFADSDTALKQMNLHATSSAGGKPLELYTILRDSSELSRPARISQMADLINDQTLSPGVRWSLRDEAAYLFARRGWADDLSLTNSPHPVTAYVQLRDSLQDQSEAQRLQSLTAAAMDVWNVFRYEAAIRLLVEMAPQSNGVILQMLRDPGNVPADQPPPFEESHTKFHVAVSLAKSVAATSFVEDLERLAGSGNPYVSSRAVEALRWVRAGVPYPYRFERLLLQLESEVRHNAETGGTTVPSP